MRIYIGGPLTNLQQPEQTKAFYKNLAAVALKNGHESYLAFMNGTDPVKNSDVLPADVYKRDIAELDKSDLMVAYVGEPSTGTGIEVEHAYHRNIPAYILYEKGKKISRMLRGCPAVKMEIIFTDYTNGTALFDEFLNKLKG